MLLEILIVGLFGFGDCITTKYFFDYPDFFRENNPIIVFIHKHSGMMGIAIIKIAILAYVLMFFNQDEMIFVLGLSEFVVLNNLIAIWKFKKLLKSKTEEIKNGA